MNQPQAKKTCHQTLRNSLSVAGQAVTCQNESCRLWLRTAPGHCAYMMVNVEEKQEYPTLLPLKDLSEVLGLSRMRVCQIEKQALTKLKALSGVDVDAQSSEEAGGVV